MIQQHRGRPLYAFRPRQFQRVRPIVPLWAVIMSLVLIGAATYGIISKRPAPSPITISI